MKYVLVAPSSMIGPTVKQLGYDLVSASISHTQSTTNIQFYNTPLCM